MFEESTVCLLYLLKSIFRNVTAYKPCTSKGGNSEMYLICISYKGSEYLANIWEALLTPYRTGIFDGTAMFDMNCMQESFISEVSECARFFMEKQIHAIITNIEYYQNRRTLDMTMLKTLNLHVANHYLEICKMKSIPKNQRVVTLVDVSWFWKIFRENDNFHLKKINSNVFLRVPESIEIFHLMSGKRITEISYSKFCSPDILPEILNLNFNPNGSCLYNYILKKVSGSSVIFNAKDFNCRPFSAFQREIFHKIRSNLGKENFIFIGIPFVTHFLVSLLYMLLSVYNKLYFYPCGALILTATSNVDNMLQCFEKIDELYKSLNIELPFDCDIIHIINPLLLCDNEFYNLVVNYNDSLIKNSLSLHHSHDK